MKSSSATLIRFHVRKANIPELLDRHDSLNRLLNQWEHAPQTRMKKERFIVHDEVLVKREAAGNHVRRERGIDTVNPVCNFMDVRACFRYL